MSRSSISRLAIVTMAALGLWNVAAIRSHGAPPAKAPPPHTMPSKPAVKQPVAPPHSTPQPKKHVNQAEPNHSASGGRGPLYIPPIVIGPQPGPQYIPPQTTYVTPNLPNGPVVQQLPTPIPANQLPATVVTVLKPNAPPQLPVSDLKPNYKVTVQAAAYSLAELVAERIAAGEQLALDGIKDGLGQPMTDDPAVAAAIQNIQNAIDNGDPLTEADLDAVDEAVGNAVQRGVPITGGFDRRDLNQALGVIAGLSLTQQLVTQLAPSGGGDIPLPQGLVDVISGSFLPEGQVAMLPSGALLQGTGAAEATVPGAANGGGVTIGQSTLAEALGLPPGAGEPLPSSIADPKGRVTSGLLIMNPASNTVDIAYVINNASQTTQAGSNHLFPGTGKWVAQFNRGPGFGDAKYSLTEGSYFFANTDHGWELYNRTFTVTIDNAENRTPFEYVVDNKPATLPPGKSQTHTSKYPMLVRFDQGGGTQPAQKQIDDPTVAKSNLRVAVNTDNNLWDLYPAKNFEPVPTQESETMLAAATAPTASVVHFAPPPAKATTFGKIKLARASATTTPKKSRLTETSWSKPAKASSPPVPAPESENK